MPRFLLEIEYKGTDYSGWQIQPDAQTIEGVLESAFSRILQQPIDIIGQGEPMQAFMQKDKQHMSIFRRIVIFTS